MTGMIPGFSDGVVDLDGTCISFSTGGHGPPLLLLHGFPQTRAMWRHVAPRLAERFTVVAADLRGYGGSTKPDCVQHMSFRLMAQDQRALMAHLGFERFHLAGHDRGARTGHRLALDAPEAVASLTVMDIVPTHLLLDNLQRTVAKAYYHWFFLAQPAPFPETMIGRDPDHYYQSCLLGWGGAELGSFDPIALDAYRAAWRSPDAIRSMCHDYRAALEIDFAHDAADLGRTVDCPALVLFGSAGVMAMAYDVAAAWSDRFSDLRAAGLPGGHFFVDLHPQDTTQALSEFLAAQPAL